MRALGVLPNPQEIYTIHEERNAGLTPSQIGARHEISGVAVQQFLRLRTNTTLLTPFDLAKGPAGGSLAVPMYWLGFITASGRVYHRTTPHTVVLSLASEDIEFVQTLVRDLLRTHPAYEFCYSSRNGHQAYIRDRDLGEALTHWGVTTDPSETALPVDYIPVGMLSHFVRGLLEGQVRYAPFGGRSERSGHPSPRVPRLTIPGAPRFIDGLQRRLEGASPAVEGKVGPTSSEATAVVTFRGPAVEAVLRYAYRDPVRSSPRADRLVKAFSSEARRDAG